MKVLFVDDEVAVLSGLRRMLRGHADWETSFAVGGEAALELVRSEPFDVVVTDMRMPGVDGLAVLNVLRAERPGTVRIVLSGHTEMSATMRTVPLAHQFLSKPCDAEELKAAITRSTRLQASLSRTRLLPIVNGIGALPSPPAVVLALNEALASSEVDIDRVLDLVSSDPAISAKLLQLVNSAFFGLGKPVNDVPSAVRYLGLTTVRDLAIAVGAFQSIEGDSQTAQIVDDVHRHSTMVAELARLFMGPSRERHEAYVAGLLHDIGSLVFASQAIDDYREVLARASTTGQSIVEIEREVFGASHAELGGYFLSVWGLPYPTVEAVLNHHVDRELPAVLTPGDATYLSELVVRSLGRGGGHPDGTVPDVPPAALRRPDVVAALDVWAPDPMRFS